MGEAKPQHDASPPQVAPDLPDREAVILAELARDADASVSFQGLRRQLGLHQQALTRTLRRLEAAGLVARRGARGYQLTEEGARAARHAPAPPDASSRHAATLVHALLPSHVSGGEVAALLARRWFAGLRWHGQSDAPGETALQWVVEPGGQRVVVRLAEGSLTLDADVPPRDAARVYAAARPVLAAIAEVYGIPAAESGSAVGAMFAGGAEGVAA